jgi:Ca2+-dependent lipid-binding protein
MHVGGDVHKTSIKKINKSPEWNEEFTYILNTYIHTYIHTTMQVGDDVHKTSIKKNNKSPEWDEEFTFPVEDMNAALEVCMYVCIHA